MGILLNVSLRAAVNSVLAIGGVGGLAVGLAGREILENLFTGLIILSSSPFEVGDEVLFTPPTGSVSPNLHSAQRLYAITRVSCNSCVHCLVHMHQHAVVPLRWLRWLHCLDCYACWQNITWCTACCHPASLNRKAADAEVGALHSICSL